MRRGGIGAVVIVAFALAACKDKDPAQVAQPGQSVAVPAQPQAAVGGGSQPVAAVAQPAARVQSEWVAKAGSIVVDRVELLAYATMGRPTGLEGLSANEKRDLATKLVVRKTIAADALQRGLGADPAVAAAETQWKYESLPPLYWAATVEKEVRIDDRELRAILKPQAEHLVSAMVFEDDAAGESKAREVLRLLEAGGDFAALAREHSEGFLAAKGGDMGWVTIPNNMIEAKEADVVAATKPGGFTQPLRTQLGWSIFQVRDRVDADRNFAALKQQELPALLSKRIQEAKNRRVQELRKRISITYPAALPGAAAGLPAAVVGGYVFPAEAFAPTGEGHGGVQQSITPAKQRLENTIDVFLIVLEAERLGIGSSPEERLGLELKRMEVLAQLQLRSGSVSVTEAEMRAEHTRYYTPDTYAFQIIVTDSRERAAEALRRERAGEGFDALAEEYNSGPLAKNKGMVPLGSPSVHPASIQAALPVLADGQVSEVLDLGNGSWGVIKRLAQQFFPLPPFEQVSGQIRKRLEMKKRADKTLAMAEEYRKKLNITYNESLLAKL
jgi:parvulin-like peptidyl-prolyl isomerase